MSNPRVVYSCCIATMPSKMLLFDIFFLFYLFIFFIMNFGIHCILCSCFFIMHAILFYFGHLFCINQEQNS